MKALCWHGKKDIRYETVPDPRRSTCTRPRRPAAPAPRDYSDRVGMALPPEEMRGKARDALSASPDLQVPSALRPYTLH